MKHILQKILGNGKLFNFIKKIYWKILDFSFKHYTSVKLDNLLISVKLILRFKLNYFDFEFYSQQNEDKYLLNNFNIEHIQNGTYLEVGAYDGFYFSNTLFLQNEFNFSGILIEAQTNLYNSLITNRPKDFLVNSAVTNSDNLSIDFIGNNLEAGVLNKLSTNLERFPDWSKYKVPNKKMSEVIKDSNFDYIDVMFIDTEGSELEVIESIDFDFPISLIVIEAHKDKKLRDKKLKSILLKEGYEFLYQIRGNYWFYNKTKRRKNGIQIRNKKIIQN